MTTCPRHGSYASRLRSVLMKMRMIMTKSMSKNMRTNMSMSMRIHFRFLCASSSPHHGRGEGIQQQPGARLTMACFTLPPWHMTARKIFATGQCQREPTTSNLSWCKQEATLLNDRRALQHRDSRCHTKSRDASPSTNEDVQQARLVWETDEVMQAVQRWSCWRRLGKSP